MGKFTSITSKLIVPEAFTKNEPISSQIIIGTPGSILRVIKRSQLSITHVKIFVLDEADTLLYRDGLGDQSIRIRK